MKRVSHIVLVLKFVRRQIEEEVVTQSTTCSTGTPTSTYMRYITMLLSKAASSENRTDNMTGLRSNLADIKRF